MSLRAAAAMAEVVLLSAWLGAAVLFAAAVAPAAFAALPSRSLAGAVVGRVLPVVFYAGLVIGVAIVVLDAAARTGTTGRTAAGAVMAVSCAVAQLLVVTRIDRLRAQIPGALEALAPDDPRRAAFGRLHAVSVGWLGVAILAAIVGLWLASRPMAARAVPLSSARSHSFPE